jgi:hypothetical protein
MKSFLTISVAALTMTLGLMAQKLETQKPDPTKVLRVETAALYCLSILSYELF